MMRRIWSGLTLMVVMRGAYLREVGARRGERLEHLAEDVHAAFVGLLERARQDVAREAGDLDVHLDGGDAALGAADLEVHVAEVVFVAEDVGQDRDALAVRDETHRDAGHGLLMGTPASISRGFPQAFQTVLRLQNSRMPSAASSRPNPERLIPPNGSSW